MPPSNLTKVQIGKLRELWEAGLTSVGDKSKLSSAMEATGLTEKVIKNWIGNERKRRGLASKRAPRDPTNTLKYVPGQKRKKSSYSVFKSTYLSSETARKMLAEGHGPGDIQTQANLAYRQLTCEEKEEFRKTADEENCADPSNARIPRQRLVKKIVANIHANMQTLDRMGCPSIWLGYTGSTPERLFSTQMSDLAEDATFTNFVISSMVNKLSKTQMAKGAQDAAPNVEKNSKRKRKKTSGKSDSQGNPEIQPVASTSSSMPPQKEPEVSMIEIEGNAVELLDKHRKLVCRGKRSSQTQVHGRTLKSGWVAVMIQDVLSKGKVEPWQEYPIHSGEVEKGSFVAWPTDHMRPQQIIPKPNISETELLKDALHPDQFDSPGTIMSRDRQLRSRT